MSKRYRLLKPLPGYEEGAEIELLSDIKSATLRSISGFSATLYPDMEPDWFEAIPDEPTRCNSPYHFDLEHLSSYGRDELKSALESIMDELVRKPPAVQGKES